MNRRLALAAVGLSVMAVALAACGSSGGGSAKPTGTSQPATTAPAPTSATTATTQASGALPTYQPSTVVSQSPGHTQLTSPDSVQKVSSFYHDALSGWTIISSSNTAYSTSITAKRGNQGATVAISSAGPAGTSISVSTYPV